MEKWNGKWYREGRYGKVDDPSKDTWFYPRDTKKKRKVNLRLR